MLDHDPQAIEPLFVDPFLDAHREAPMRIVIDLDAISCRCFEHEHRVTIRSTAPRKALTTAMCREYARQRFEKGCANATVHTELSRFAVASCGRTARI